MRVITALGLIVLIVLAVSCTKEQEVKVYSFSYAFADSTSSWTGDFADYPEDSAGYRLHFEHDTLPFNINTDSSRFSLKLSGVNLNNTGLFMFLKRKISGLRPNKTYQVIFNIRVASSARTGVTPTGTYPGDSVFVKAGATEWEPEKELVLGQYVMNLDKGDAELGGQNMITLGHIGVNSTTNTYALITRNNNVLKEVLVRADDRGELWVIVGTDSNYPLVTTLYYTQIDVFFNEVD